MDCDFIRSGKTELYEILQYKLYKISAALRAKAEPRR
jgi:hypothetical protein